MINYFSALSDDYRNGGDGIDTYNAYNAYNNGLYIAGLYTYMPSDLIAYEDGYGGSDSLLNLEHIIGSQYGNNTIYLDDNNSYLIETFEGDDAVYAGSGNDTINIGSGADFRFWAEMEMILLREQMAIIPSLMGKMETIRFTLLLGLSI